jgi:cell division protein FtsL
VSTGHSHLRVVSSERPHLRLVRRRSRALIDRRSTRLAPLAVLAAICVAAVVLTVLLEQVVLAQSAFKMSRVRKSMMAAEARNQELLLDVTKLQSPGRIERFARDTLGMVEPDNLEYVVARVRAPGTRVAHWRSSRSAPGSGQAADFVRNGP